MTGLCYNELECLASGGSISGYCSPVALGACCVFKNRNCGRTVAQKISYFTNPNYPAEDKKPIACLLKEREQILIVNLEKQTMFLFGNKREELLFLKL